MKRSDETAKIPRGTLRVVEACSAGSSGVVLGDDWENEIARRIVAFDAGEMTAAPVDEVFARVRARLSR